MRFTFLWFTANLTRAVISDGETYGHGMRVSGLKARKAIASTGPAASLCIGSGGENHDRLEIALKGGRMAPSISLTGSKTAADPLGFRLKFTRGPLNMSGHGRDGGLNIVLFDQVDHFFMLGQRDVFFAGPMQ